MSLLIQFLGIIFVFLAGLVGAYYLFLALYALQHKENKSQINTSPKYTFAILIPAHNEESTIGKTLAACAELDYPNEKYKVFVIADNCEDHTADIARKSGAICFERYNENDSGKGYALQWGFSRILPYGSDAIIVLDADCTIESHALQILDNHLSCGCSVLQMNDVASNPDVSPISYAVTVGNWIENELFYRPKSELGWAVFLRGTGMVFRRDILEKYPWRAFSVAEDVEYGINLLKNGVKVKFVDNVRVMSEFPADYEQLQIQRTRWAHGNLGFSKRHAIKFICQGIRDGNLTLFDSGVTLLIISRPLVLLIVFLALLFSVLSWWVASGVLSNNTIIAAIIIFSIYLAYFLIGIITMGLSKKRISLLVRTPLVVLKLIGIAFRGLVGNRSIAWVRSPRP